MKRLFPVFTVACLLAAHSHAQVAGKYDTSKPIEITADELEVLQKDQKAEFRGNVIAVQGDLKMTSDIMTVYYKTGDKIGADGQSISSIEVQGHVFLATPQETAQGKRGKYDVVKDKIILIDDVVLTRGENVVKGSTLEYDLKTGRSQIVGGVKASGDAEDGKPVPKGRVRGLFVPAKNTDAKSKEAEAPAQP